MKRCLITNEDLFTVLLICFAGVDFVSKIFSLIKKIRGYLMSSVFRVITSLYLQLLR
ncbi:hypothetical protein VJY32_06155 [Ignavibacteria bacterium 4148-Me]